jgi:DeoR/GlpR family transcriptional regulator of sugar metabolism
MLPKERQQRIVNIVNNRGGCTVDKLAAELNVSDATIRRDLQELDNQNLIERTYGGASPTVSHGMSYDSRKTCNKEAKRAIGKRAADEIFRDQTVLFDSGSTTREVAIQTTDVEFSPVTPMPQIAHELSLNGLQPNLTGGKYQAGTYSCTGQWTEKFINKINFDVLLLCTDGINNQGLTTQNMQQSYLKQTMIQQSERVILVADNSKISSKHAYNFANLSDIDAFITDQAVNNKFQTECESAGVDLVTNINKK